METLELRLALSGLSLLYNGQTVNDGDTISLGAAGFDDFEFKLAADADANSEVLGKDCVHVTRFELPSQFNHRTTPIGCLPAGATQDIDLAIASLENIESDAYEFLVEYENGGEDEQIAFTAMLEVTEDSMRIPGDTNNDMEVNFADFLVMSGNFNQEVTDGYKSGDFDNSGSVDFSDFLQVSNNFGKSFAADSLSDLFDRINPEALDDALKARADLYVVDQDTRLVVDAVDGVLGNDISQFLDRDVPGRVPNLEALTARLLDPPIAGNVTFNADGSFDYVPAFEQIGSVEFTYIPADAFGETQPETVNITIVSEFTFNTAVKDRYFADQDAVLIVDANRGLLANDNDEADPLSAALFEQPQNGSVIINKDGSFVYTPAANFSGIDRFSYMAHDTLFTSQPATVEVIVI